MTAAVPVVGLELVEAVRAGQVRVKPAAEAFTEDGVRFADGSEATFDAVILATGFQPAIDPVAPYLDGAGGSKDSTLFVVGARYPVLETFLQQLRREAAEVARGVTSVVGRNA